MQPPMGQAEVKAWLKEKTNIEKLFPDYISLESILAVGGQGVVFRGKVNHRDAAIKVYFPGQLQQHIDREVSALETLNCDSVVKMLWYGAINVFDLQLPVVATELINGTDLSNLYKQRTISLDELGKITYDVSEAIDAMWNQRIVHRDIKPSNILIRDDGRACLIDLGVARHLDDTSLTALGSTWGTLGYLSPEQAKSIRQLTCKSDVFALGVLIVECAIQRHPSQGDQLRLFALGLHQKLPEPLNSWEYSGFIRSMLNPEPMRRPKPGDILTAFSNFRREDY
jgi:serine/threonine protein kinase